jgi:predicted component of type VI protein secretion system
MVPAHGSSLKPPPDTTPDDAAASSFAWMVRASKDSSTVAGAHLRRLGSHARGDPQKQRRHQREDATRVLRKPASFLCAYVYLEGGARQVRSGQAPKP